MSTLQNPPAPGPVGPGLPSGPTGPGAPTPGTGPSGWTAGRVVAGVAGLLLVLASLLAVTLAATALWLTHAQDEDGYLGLGTTTYGTPAYALVTSGVRLWGDVPQAVDGVRLTVTSADAGKAVFVAVGPTARVDAYLGNVARTRVEHFGTDPGAATQLGGTSPGGLPSTQPLWVAQASGTGTQVLTWSPQGGDWTFVAMNADASAGLTVRVGAAVALPWLPWVGWTALAVAVLMLAVGLTLFVAAARRARLR